MPIEGPHEDDRFWIERLAEDGAKYGVAGRPFEPSRWLADGDQVDASASSRFDVRHCPGHTPGHVVFHHPESNLALVGDVLFKGSVGRWDFPRGDQQQLIRSITTRLWPMGDETAFVPGHGPMSTFGHERATNPFVGDAALAANLAASAGSALRRIFSNCGSQDFRASSASRIDAIQALLQCKGQFRAQYADFARIGQLCRLPLTATGDGPGP